MDIFTNLSHIDFSLFLLSAFIIISSIIFACEIIEKFSKLIGRPVKWVQNNEKDHYLLTENTRELNELKGDVKKLTDMFIDKQIDDMRYEILHFASALSGGGEFSKEPFDHILKTYQKYEKILEENHMSNGQVQMSMEVINDIYKEKLKNGFNRGETQWK